jgi:hypothetical protein
MAVIDPNAEWIGNVQPTGLVVAANVLARHGLNPAEQTRADTEIVRALLAADDDGLALPDPWSFFTQVLGWRAGQVAGAPDGPALPADLSIRVEESAADLAPHWAVSKPDNGWQILVRLESPGVDPDHRGALEGWEATPHQRLERLLRETGVPTGLLLTDGELRLIHAPRGETSGWLKFPLRSLGEVGGRPMLGGLKLVLSSFRLHNDAPDRCLAALLQASRDAQAEVSTKLAAQVLGALHELLRGLHSADKGRIEALAASRPEHLYEGLLTVLLRLVFLLYAEDRDLIPSRTDGEARALYDQGYGVRSLYARLLDDAAHHPDTMDERRGAWARLLALFRLVHRGDNTGWIRGRGGKLFDPDAFPFLQGQDTPADQSAPAIVSDGCILRILDLLLSLDGEKLSYRTLDVEQIGSVYETVMGFTVETLPGPAIAIRAGKNDRTPVFVDLAALITKKGTERAKFLKEEADRNSVTDKVGKPLVAAAVVADAAAALRAIVDERGSPGGQVAPPGTPLLQPTDERRRTGSHYTPRSLTEPMVRHALEPAFERLGPNATPEQVLELKVCDPAMGSGAFLVEACRALAARLVETWSRYPEKKPVIPLDEDEELHARRLVAQRCLYGVDKNPLATDLAKLSLWLATLARDHEFTFLDHALKSGDSLVGLTQVQIAATHWDTSKPGLPLFRQLVKDRVAEAMKGRAEIQAAPDDTARAIQEHRHKALEARVAPIRTMGDAVIAAFFAENNTKARERKRADVESWLTGSLELAWGKLAALAATLKQGAYPLMPFHWEIEFPEVFARENGGFDCIVGNPPFLGSSRISEVARGPVYQHWLKAVVAPSKGQVDLSVFFFHRSFSLIREHGTLGLLATGAISYGENRIAGLAQITSHCGTIYYAATAQPWPGEAAVLVSSIHICKCNSPSFVGPRHLNGQACHFINSRLQAMAEFGEPQVLLSSIGLAHIGTKISRGFVLDKDEAAAMLNIPENRDVILPLTGGEEVNASPSLQNNRFAICFGTRSLTEAARWPAVLDLVRDRVLPQRMKTRDHGPGAHGKKYWWQHVLRADPLYRAIAGLDRCLVISEVSTHHALRFETTNRLFNHKVYAFAFESYAAFAILQSSIHELWSSKYSARHGATTNYSPRKTFATFPFPPNWEIQTEAAGKAYYQFRAALMIASNEGMTKTYNRFHDRTENGEKIRCLRQLHAAMDRIVLETYGWRDLAACASPIFGDETNEDDRTYQGRLVLPSEVRDEVLARLLALNAERHAEEVNLGTALGMKGRAREDDETEEEDVD